MLEIKVCVHLRRRDVRVAEQFLHTAQILARFEQMRRERMPEQVWVGLDIQALAARPLGDSELDGPRTETPAVAADEHRSGADARPRASRIEPRTRRHDRLCA